MISNLFLVIKGFVMGIANVIPGVSGGTIAIILGIYEKFIDSISHFFSNFKDNLKFLIPIGIGMLLSILTMSNLVTYSYEKLPIPTTLFFVGLVIGGIPLIYSKIKDHTLEKKKISNYIILLLTFSLVIFMALADKIFQIGGEVVLTNLNFIGYILLFIIGVVAAATMVIPGISGSLVLMLFGYYYPIINLIKELTHFKNLFSNMLIACIFGIGVLLGIVLVSKLVEFLLKKFEIKTYYGVLGFILASIIAIPISSLSNINLTTDVFQIILSILFPILGFVISYKLGEH